MKYVLIGYTGFVGSNLAKQFYFDGLYNSKNVQDSYGTNPDILVYSGVPAQKFIANKDPEKDFQIIEDAIENIKKINPKKLILISTIDVFNHPNEVTEDSEEFQTDEAYGRNRHYLETWVQDNFKDYLIVRLPGLYGLNLKKNFIYDLINVIPSMLKDEKYNELVLKDSKIKKYYEKLDNGFYKCIELNNKEKDKLKNIFRKIGFTALNFTDSRATFQFYNLKNLWKHINIAMDNNIKVLNVATEPISINELYKYLYNETFTNEITNNIPYYNFKTKYDKLFKGKNGYILNKKDILEDIKNYIEDALKVNINLAISNIAWNKEDNKKVYEFLKKNNINYLEIAPTKIVEDKPYDNLEVAKNEIKKLKNEYGIDICSMQSIWFGRVENIFESKENFNSLIDYTKKAIDFAHTINCNNLVFGCPKNRNITNYEKDYPKALKFFKSVGEYALEKGVVIAIEPNPTIYNTNFLNYTKDAIEFVKEINLESIKVNYDFGTVIENDESLDILKDNLRYINHIHISEPNLLVIKKRAIHKKLINILKAANYKKVVSIEMKQTDIDNVFKTLNYIIEISR